MSMEHDDARAEDEAFASIEQRDKARLARRLELVRQYQFNWIEGEGLRARLGGGGLEKVVEQLQARVASLEARVAVLEGGSRTY